MLKCVQRIIYGKTDEELYLGIYKAVEKFGESLGLRRKITKKNKKERNIKKERKITQAGKLYPKPQGTGSSLIP